MTERSMVDTNVLIFAFRKERPDDKPDLCGWRDASIRLLKGMRSIRVSAIAWIEFMRGIQVEDRSVALFQKIQAEMIDGRTADRAIELMKARNLP